LDHVGKAIKVANYLASSARSTAKSQGNLNVIYILKERRKL